LTLYFWKLQNNCISISLKSLEQFRNLILAGLLHGGILLSSGYAQRIVFTNLTSEDGLNYEGVRAMVQDPQGFMWLANGSDLKRYDGHEVLSSLGNSISGTITAATRSPDGKIYLSSAADGLLLFDPVTGSLNNLSKTTGIHSLAADAAQTVWIAAETGLYRWYEKGKVLKRITPDGFPAVNILTIDAAGNIWAGTQDGGLFRKGTNDNSLEHVWKKDASISALIVEEDGIWVGTKGKGLFHLNTEFNEIENYLPNPDDLTSFPALEVHAAIKTSEGGLWFGTDSGLSRFFPSTGRFYNYYGDQDDSRSLPSNRIYSLTEDRSGVLWIGSRTGVSRFPLKQNFFERVKHRPGEHSTLSHDSVHFIFPDKEGRIWVATEDGLNVSNSLYGGFRKPAVPANSALRKRAISAITQGSQGGIWIGTKGAGLVRIDPVRGEFLEFRHDGNNSLSLPGDDISDVVSDLNGQIWVSTKKGVIARLDSSSGIFTTLDLPDWQNAGAIEDVHCDHSGRLWVAREDGTIVSFVPASEGKNGEDPSAPVLVPGKIGVLRDDNQGRIWIGTRDSGLFVLSPKTRKLTHYNRTNSQLPDDQIAGIELDQEDYVWVSTSLGLARFDSKSAQSRSFNIEDGLQSMVFHPHCSAVDANGRLYFGGPRGINIIDTEKLPERPASVSPFLTGLKINGERVMPSGEGGSALTRSMVVTDIVKLPYDKESRLTLAFSTLNYAVSKNHFRYMLNPLDTNWKLADGSHEVTWSALEPGEYLFEVQSSLDGSNWAPDRAQVMLHITPPWFRTLWATFLFSSIGLGIAAVIARFVIISRIRKAKQLRQDLEIQRNKAEADLAGEVTRSMLLQRASDGGGASTQNPFSAILTHLQSHFGSDCCSIHSYVSVPEPRLSLSALNRKESSRLLGLDQINPRNSLIEKVLTSTQAVVSNNVAEDEDLGNMRQPLAQLGVKSLLAVRTISQGAPNGVLMLFHLDKSGEWLDEDVRMLEAIGAQLGTAITNQRLIEEDAKQKKELAEARVVADVANQTKSDFLAKMTHELRTPLNAILGFSEILENDERMEADQLETLRIINGSGEHLLEVINDVLDMAKIEAGGFELNEEKFDLYALMEAVENMLAGNAREKGLKLQFQREPGTPQMVVADKPKLRQVLVNLLGNALKFTEKGGITVRVSSRLEQNDPKKTRLHFEIEDTGNGVAEEELHKLFEKFGQSASGKKSREGTGLGLPITKSFVELLGGKISVKSTVDVGTTFLFDVLCEVAVTKNSTDKSAKKTNTTAGKTGKIRGFTSEEDEIRILIAEDQPANRILLSALLKKAGFTIAEAENGKIAVEKWQEWQPHLIFMDQEMPVMGGNDATREITRLLPDASVQTTIISLTAHALEDSRKAAMDAGCLDFLPKPFKQEQLYDIIAKYLPVTYEYKS
jgi:signal transduction histidine kinase/ligand-binding sensor domain-containing protein/ActR/RegA family two-component response regulator